MDNISIIGRTKSEVKQAAEKINGFSTRLTFPSLGLMKSRLIDSRPLEWSWTSQEGMCTTSHPAFGGLSWLAESCLVGKRVPGKLVEIWQGHITSLFMSRRPHMASLHFSISTGLWSSSVMDVGFCGAVLEKKSGRPWGLSGCVVVTFVSTPSFELLHLRA